MKVASSENLSLSRLAVLIAFFINGGLLATWVSRIPGMQSKLDLSEGALGLLLLGLAAGVLVALSLAGGVIARFGSPNVTLVGAIVMCLTLPFAALASQPFVLWVVLFVFGGAMSVMDVAMNEQAVLVERKMGRPIMSSFHAAFSIGGLVGALIGAGLASTPSLRPFIHFIIVVVIFGIAIVFVYRHLLPVKREFQQNESVFRMPERALWLLGLVAFCTAIGEGAMADWSGVYLTQVLQTTVAFAALGFAAFSLTMTVGRLVGDKIAIIWKSVSIVRFGGLIAALGFLAGPPLIGLIAEATSLRIAFLLVATLVGTLFFTANTVSP